MNVNFGGRAYSFQVKPGPEGYKEFTKAICHAFDLPGDSELNITFTCDEPSSGGGCGGGCLCACGWVGQVTDEGQVQGQLVGEDGKSASRKP